MSHIHTRKMLSDKYPFVGMMWWYDFSAELRSCAEEDVKRFLSAKYKAFASLTKKWNHELNTEWTCRTFYAAKMVLAASLMIENLEYARHCNMKVCIPYLQYYAMLYSLKALVLVIPQQEWGAGTLIEQTHAKTINIACNELSQVDGTWDSGIDGAPPKRETVLRLKAFRELISYRAPSSGGRLLDYETDVLPLCRLPVELAQMVSEILEGSLAKNMPVGYEPVLIDAGLSCVHYTRIGHFEFEDQEDYYRIGYLFRKHPMPANIQHIMTEGHVEDFFGSWCDKDNRDGAFNPDENWRVLFDVP